MVHYTKLLTHQVSLVIKVLKNSLKSANFKLKSAKMKKFILII